MNCPFISQDYLLITVGSKRRYKLFLYLTEAVSGSIQKSISLSHIFAVIIIISISCLRAPSSQYFGWLELLTSFAQNSSQSYIILSGNWLKCGKWWIRSQKMPLMMNYIKLFSPNRLAIQKSVINHYYTCLSIKNSKNKQRNTHKIFFCLQMKDPLNSLR